MSESESESEGPAQKKARTASRSFDVVLFHSATRGELALTVPSDLFSAKSSSTLTFAQFAAELAAHINTALASLGAASCKVSSPPSKSLYFLPKAVKSSIAVPVQKPFLESNFLDFSRALFSVRPVGAKGGSVAKPASLRIIVELDAGTSGPTCFAVPNPPPASKKKLEKKERDEKKKADQQDELADSMFFFVFAFLTRLCSLQ
jgi:hypothetical protein